jgi:glycosyltransferase involved in cell wall biosynthesis
VVKNDYPKNKIEVFVVDGQSTDNTRSIVKDYTRKYKFIHLLENINRTVPYAMNIGIKKSSGDFIIRLDAHGEYPSNYFSELVFWSKSTYADNIGARWITDVKNKNLKTNAIKKVLSAKFGVGNSYFRIGTDNMQEVDTVPFGCYRRIVFEKIGLYDTRLNRNQDIELNKRLKRNNGKVYLLSNLSSIYYARETFLGIAKNNFSTGLWNILTVYLTKRIDSISLRHFIPLIFILSLILPVLAMYWFPSLGIVTLFSFGLYMISLTLQSIKVNDSTTSFGYVFLAFLVLHFSYGFGSLLGLFRIDYLFKKK